MLRSAFRVLSTASLAAAFCIAPAFAPAQMLSAQSTAAATEVSPDITMLDAGAAPRQTLRYKFVGGATEKGMVRQKITMNIEMGGMALPPQSLPGTISTIDYTVGEVAADGSAAVTGEFVKMEVDAEGADPMLVSAMSPQITGMTGAKTTFNVSPTGVVTNTKFDGGSPEVSEALKSLGSMDQMSVAFPTEPVGVGARWKAARPVTQNGLTIQQNVEYLVKSLSADSMVLEMVLIQTAKDQVMDAAGMPAGASATLKTLDGKGTASVVVRFNSVQPSFDMKMDIKMALDLTMNGQANSMNQTMVMEMTSGPVATP